MVKRLLAVGTGATMLGATAMGAMAAGLGSYPDMFVTDGTFNGFLVVGEAAAPIDNLAMTDIAAAMQYTAASETTTTTLEGDTWLVGTSSKYLEMANSNATASAIGSETFRDISTFIGDEELEALADGTWATNEADYTFQQFLFFDDQDSDLSVNRIVKYIENDDDVTSDYLYFKNGHQIARYKLEFSSSAQSDVTDSAGSADSTGTYLDDFENTALSFLGKQFAVVTARRSAAGPQGGCRSAKLTLMGGATKDTLLEGETKTYTISDTEYEVMLSFTDADECKFTVNGQATNKLKVGETYVLADDSEVGVSEVLYQDYAGGVHSCTFYLGAQKVVIQDDDTSNGVGSHRVKVGSEDVDGTEGIITGSDDNTTASITTIEVNMSAEDDYFVGAGEKLSDAIIAAGEEEEVLFTENWNVEYQGLVDQTTNDIGLYSSSAKRYQLRLYDGDNNKVDIPIAYAESTVNLTVGEDSAVGTSRTDQKRLALTEAEYIYKNDYFIITGGTASDGSAKSYLLQYKGQDDTDKTSPKIKFKNAGSGDSLEYSAATTNATATIKLGGYSFIVHGQSSTADDAPILVDLNGGGTVAVSSNITFVDYYGSQWAIQPYWSPQSVYENKTAVTLRQTTPNGDDYDNVLPSTIVLNITLTTGPEVRADITGLTLITPDGETEVSYGYTSMGAKVTFKEPSSDPDELVLTYPEKQARPQVYVTSGAITSSSSTGGELTRVTVVDATKLDSEIASAEAQNLIVIGGPCVNTIAADLLGSPADCTEGFTPGKARVKLFEHANGNVAMLVAGYSGADTRLAGKVIAHRWAELSGTEVEVEGTTYSDATIAAPIAAE